MKLLAFSSLVAIAVFPPVAMGDPQQEIVAVAPALSVDDWVAGISHKIDDKLRYPHYLGQPSSGGVSLVFRCSDSGAPAAIEIVQRSRDRKLDNAAIAAVRRIKSLHPLPAGIGDGQVFQANIVFATDEPTLKKEMAKLQSAMRRPSATMAAGGSRPLQIAVGATGSRDRVMR